MSKRMTKAELPQSLGAFKPVDHVMVALPTQDAASDAVRALQEAGFEPDDILYFGAQEGGAEMARMLEGASEASGFGYEIVLMRRYLELSRQGCLWILVYSPKDEQAETVKQIAQRFHAPMAVKYHLLVVEDLI